MHNLINAENDGLNRDLCFSGHCNSLLPLLVNVFYAILSDEIMFCD